MGEHRPEVGERIAYYRRQDGVVVFGTVVAVTFWDLVDLQLEDGGEVILGVRRVIEMDECEDRSGRFARIGKPMRPAGR